MIDRATAQLSAHLAEHARLVGENHTTFQRQQQQINAMVLLMSGIVGGLLTKPSIISDNPEVFVIIPIPFLLITALHLRDDLKLHAMDEYIWLVLRERVKYLTGSTDEEIWNWLQVADRFKFATDRESGFYFILSLSRYLFPFVLILASLILYISSIWLGHFSAWYWKVCFCFDLLVTMVIFGEGLRNVMKGGKYIRGQGWVTRGLIRRSSD